MIEKFVKCIQMILEKDDVRFENKRFTRIYIKELTFCLRESIITLNISFSIFSVDALDRQIDNSNVLLAKGLESPFEGWNLASLFVFKTNLLLLRISSIVLQ
jgi:hypothetical protein